MKKRAGDMGDTMRSATRALYERVAVLVAAVSSDEDSRRAELILNIILVAGIVCLGILDVLLSDRTYITVTLIIFIGLFVSSKRGHSRAASYILICVCSIGATYVGWVFDVGLPAMLLMFVFISAISGLIINAKNSKNSLLIPAILIVILTILGIHEVRDFGLRAWEYEILRPTDVITYAVIILFIAGISRLSNHELEKSLHRARQSEKELEYERDLLEIKVAERTAELSRIAEFGRLARGLFHDLMTPLTSVALQMEKLGRLEKTADIGAADGDRNNLDNTNNPRTIQETQDYIKRAVTASNKMASFMENVRRHMQQDGSYGGSDIVEMCDIGSEATLVIELLSYMAREAKVTVERDFETTAGTKAGRGYHYPANPFYFHQIFQNLISNAIEACTGVNDRIVRVKISEQGQDKKSGGKIRIVVADNGPGIAAKNMLKIFQPFFTTKASRRNSGIGLHTVKTVVEEKLKGKLTIESTENVGTTCIIDLP